MKYTYLVGWSELDTWYYGRRTAKNCSPDELWVTYFTSSRHVKEFREINGEPDIVDVRKVFTSVNECVEWEHRFLRKVNAARNNKFLNKTNGDLKFDTTGRIWSTEERLKISKSRTGKKRTHVVSEETREKLRKNATNPSKETIEKRRLKMVGRKHTAETIEKFKIAHSNISDGTKSKISKSRTGQKVKTEFLHKWSENAKGDRNNNAKTINIYDNTNTILYTTHGNFAEFCKQHNLPFGGLSRSYREDGKKLVKSPFRDWYAKIVD